MLGARLEETNRSFINILIIEDKYARSYVVKLGLHYHYCHTILVHGLQTGLECLADMPAVQFIVLENPTASSEWLSLMAKIRNHPQWKHIPVILVAAEPDPNITQLAIRLRCRHALAAPFKAKQLLDKIDQTLLEDSFRTPCHQRVYVRGAFGRPVHHIVLKWTSPTTNHANQLLEKKTMIAYATESVKPVRGIFQRPKKRDLTTVAQWLSGEIRLFRRAKPNVKAQHKIVTLAEWLFDEIRMINWRAARPKSEPAKKISSQAAAYPEERKAAPSAEASLDDQRLSDETGFPINIQYMILFQKAPYLLSTSMQKQIGHTISRDR